MTLTVKQKLTEATALYGRKLKNYREKCAIAEEWDKELGPIVVDEAHRVGLDLPIALALVQIETGPFEEKNIFGGNQGHPFLNQRVSEGSMKMFRDFVDAGNSPVGVGPAQLTDYDLIKDAEELGGAHIPRYTLRVAFRELKRLVKNYDVYRAFVYYNGEEGIEKTRDSYSWNVYMPEAIKYYGNYKNEIDAIRS